MRPKLDPAKLASLPIVDDMLAVKYGIEGEISRTEFEVKSRAWYYDEIYRDIYRDKMSL